LEQINRLIPLVHDWDYLIKILRMIIVVVISSIIIIFAIIIKAIMACF